MTKLDELWERAEMTGKPVEIGDIVLCDFCSKDFTASVETGGFVFGSKGCCPICAPSFLTIIENCRETQFIRARCPEGKSFADFIRDYRGPNAKIQVIKCLK